MASTQEIHKELDLIQSIIERMSSNSFEVKKWLIGILTAITLFKYDKLLGSNVYYIWVMIIPIISFWILNAFYLSSERKYREIYNWVIIHRPKTKKYLYDLNTMNREYTDCKTINLDLKENSVFRVFFSITILPFYLTPILFIAFYTFTNLKN